MNTKYIKGVGIWYGGTLPTIKKKENVPLQPIYEAFTNSLEAIFEKKENTTKGQITISLFFVKDMLSNEDGVYKFQKIVIEDTGIGFNDINYSRLINLRDNQKGFSNKGTGRIQFIHSFDKTIISSIYKDETSKTGYKRRVITLSKNDAFLKQNAIIRLDSEEEVSASAASTSLMFETILDNKEVLFYTSLTAENLKDELVRHYLSHFCEIRDKLPIIEIKTYKDGEEKAKVSITSNNIPTPNKEQPIEISYSRVIGNRVEQIDRKETFNLKAFLLPATDLNKNTLSLVSKGEFAKELKIDNLLPMEQINGKRYLFLLSGQYIDERDSDTRGNIDIPLKKDFKKRNMDSLMGEEAILLEDIEERTNNVIHSLYKEIDEKYKEKEKSIRELQELFLLNLETINSLQGKIKIDDDDETILRKIYESDARIVAERDAKIKKQFEELERLTPNNRDYQTQLQQKVNEFVKTIPLQNRTALTQYVARRKIVLTLFQKILDRELDKLKNGGRIDEKLMHNLVFQESSNNPKNSDLWLINEECIYFQGYSNTPFNQIKINSKAFLKDEFTIEEERYLSSLGENRKKHKPDILLFPEEGKCIIIEFKAPDVNVSDHLTQIDKYANLILNYTKEEFQIDTFYGYLIGESIESRDVLGTVGRYEESSHFNYFFRPAEKVNGFDGRKNGSIYTEVLKYSTLLERAKIRNKIFIDKLETIKEGD
jgi:hypothetical protein